MRNSDTCKVNFTDFGPWTHAVLSIVKLSPLNHRRGYHMPICHTTVLSHPSRRGINAVSSLPSKIS